MEVRRLRSLPGAHDGAAVGKEAVASCQATKLQTLTGSFINSGMVSKKCVYIYIFYFIFVDQHHSHTGDGTHTPH